MNYEQKYNEALEWMRSIYPTMQGADKEDAEHYFPELRESEDERIRKELIERFNWELKGAEEQDSAGCSRQKDIAMFKRGIAWLEQQGEQNPADKVKSTEHSYITPNPEFFQWIYDRLVYVHNENPNVDYMLSLKERIEDMQKPSWSKEDSKNLNSVEWIIENSENLNRIFETISSPEYIKKYFIDWLKSLKPQNYWKPSEELMEALFEAKLASINNREYFLGLLYEDLTKL